MAFTNVNMSTDGIQYHEFTRITCTNTSTGKVMVWVFNITDPLINACIPMRSLGSDNFTLDLYGWMVGAGSGDKVEIHGLNGDIDTSLSPLTITVGVEPLIPLMQFFKNYIETEPTLSTYQKTVKIVVPGERYITDIAQFVIVIDSGTFEYPNIGDVQNEYLFPLTIRLTDEVRHKTDHSRHATFIKIISDYLINNSGLHDTLGIISAVPVDFTIPEDEYEEKTLATSEIIIDIMLKPYYA